MSASKHDVEMASVQDADDNKNGAQDDQVQKVLSVSRNPADDVSNATYSFYGEDHTLGNLLRNQIVKNKHVEFCAYSVPHPSEAICNVRIQLTQSDNEAAQIDTNKVLKASLKRVSRVCDALTEKFEARLQEFKANQAMSE